MLLVRQLRQDGDTQFGEQYSGNELFALSFESIQTFFTLIFGRCGMGRIVPSEAQRFAMNSNIDILRESINELPDLR